MTTTLNAAIEAATTAIQTASAQWTGLEWTSGPQELLAALKRERLVDEVDGACWWPADGSNDSALLTERWHRLLSDVGDADEVTPALVERAEAMVEAEAAYVAGRAELAADEGRCALELLAAGDYETALDHVNKAAQIEHEFGDDPSWGPAVKAVKALVAVWAESIEAADDALDALDAEEDEARLEGDLAEAEAAQASELERLLWDGSDDDEEVARTLTPGQAWDQYVGDQSVAEWVANDGPTDCDGLEEYLAQAWPRDTTDTTRPILARRLADYLAAAADTDKDKAGRTARPAP